MHLHIIIYISQLPGKLGIDIFVILSSYFMIDSRFNFKKIIRLIGETLFYSISILLVFSLFTSVHINIFDIIKSLFPILFTEYWFITDYILLMIITPFLNDFIKSLEKNNYKKLLITLIILNVIINGTFHFFIKHISNILIWFIILYLIVGYIKKYNVIKDNNYKRNIIYFIIIIFIYFLCVSLFTVVGHILNKDILIVNTGYFGTENSIFTVLAAFEIFVAFLKMKPRTYKFINTIASSTLGIYLIHDNNIMRQFLWNNIFRV